MVGHVAFQTQVAEPAIRQVQMQLVAQTTLRPDPHAVADDQHPDHQLRIDRRTARLAIKRPQVRADIPIFRHTSATGLPKGPPSWLRPDRRRGLGLSRRAPIARYAVESTQDDARQQGL